MTFDSLADAPDPVRALFDAAHYLDANPDVAASGQDPFSHFTQWGWREGRDPSRWFVLADYLAANPDVAQAGLNGFEHYVRYGRAEGRALSLRTSVAAPIAEQPAGDSLMLAEFDAHFYLAQNPDIAAAGLDAFEHFRTIGWTQDRDPNRWFSMLRYRKAHADIPAEVNGFEHYVHYGRAEGRALEHAVGFRYDILSGPTTIEDRVQAMLTLVPDVEASGTDALTDALDAIADTAPWHLTFSHDDYTTVFGGVQLCLRLESDAVRAAGIAHIHLHPARAAPVIDIDRQKPRLALLINGAEVGHFDHDTLASAFRERAGGRAVSFAIHSLIAHRVDEVTGILQATGATGGFYWLHDFSSLCANFTLMRNDVEFCGAPPPESLACEICTYGARRRIQLTEHVRLFQAFDMTVLAPSASALSLWRRSFPIKTRAQVHPHAWFTPRATVPDAIPPKADGPLRIAFLGMPNIHKGWPLFAQIVSRFGADPRYQFHHLAKATDPRVGALWTHVAPTPDAREPMIAAVETLAIDVAFVWSLWPETFCFAAYEAVAGGAAILTHPGAGNVFDLVRTSGAGQVVTREDELIGLFEGNGLMALRRSGRDATLQGLAYSAMTADFIDVPAA